MGILWAVGCQCWRSTSKRSKALFSVLLLGITVQVHLASTTLSLASIDLMEGAMVLDAKTMEVVAIGGVPDALDYVAGSL